VLEFDLEAPAGRVCPILSLFSSIRRDEVLLVVSNTCAGFNVSVSCAVL
jgi:hypothetical protein